MIKELERFSLVVAFPAKFSVDIKKLCISSCTDTKKKNSIYTASELIVLVTCYVEARYFEK